jgi:predicted HicB family RNase H-like nuclease
METVMFNGRLPIEDRHALKIQAAKEGVTMNSIIVRLIQEYLASANTESVAKKSS